MEKSQIEKENFSTEQKTQGTTKKINLLTNNPDVTVNVTPEYLIESIENTKSEDPKRAELLAQLATFYMENRNLEKAQQTIGKIAFGSKWRGAALMALIEQMRELGMPINQINWKQE